MLGTAHLGSALPEALSSAGGRARAFQLLDGALEAGCPTLDLAASYMLGGTERLVGAWLRARRHREALFLISKGGHPVPLLSPNRVTARALAEDLHGSLRRLGTDFIDLYLLHRDHPRAALQPLVEALAGYQRAGKIRAWGVSNWAPPRIEQLLAIAGAEGLSPPVASSPHFSLAEWASPPWSGCVSLAGPAQAPARAFYTRSQLPVLAYSPLGHGFFSASPAPTDRAYRGQENEARRQRAALLAKKHAVSSTDVALAYLFNQPFPTYAIVAVSSVAHLRAALESRALQLTSDELRWLETGAGG